MIQAANDGCIVLAEGLAGSEAAFAEKLNARAAEIGMTDSRFVNSTGLPADGQHTTVRDMVRLATHLIDAYPDLYPIFAEDAFTWNGIFQRNRNPLLTLNIDADGLAIGFTEGEGFSLVGSVQREGRRVVAALGGLSSASVRTEESRRLLDWGIRGFIKKLIFEPGEMVGSVQLFGGEKSSLVVRSATPVHILIPVDNRDRITARIVYDGPISAPIREGAPVGTLRVWIGETMTQETPLVSAETVGAGTLTQRAADAVVELLTGWIRLI
jgi:D-alanyl-D-alanine carboxypeptidase (penicillin-binding protein 5/6)